MRSYEVRYGSIGGSFSVSLGPHTEERGSLKMYPNGSQKGEPL